VKAELPKASTAGRPRLPAFVKALSQIEGVIDEIESEALETEHVQQYSQAKVKAVLDKADEDLVRLAQLVASLRNRLSFKY
jgi:hypothetical protein